MTFTPTEPARQQTEGGRILVGICSCRSNRDKRDAVRETWLSIPAPGIDCRFFVGGGTPIGDEPDVIVLPVNDDYEHLPSKVRAFFAEALATSDFDWLFKCDDDTYVALERLRGVIDGVHELVGNEFIQSRGFPSGGAGYLLSRRLVRILADDVTLPGTGAEDVSIGRAAISHGASAIGLPCLCWDRSRSPLPGNYVVTSHWCAPEQLRVAHAMLHECPNEIEAVHPSWSDRLWLYPSGFFSRCSTSCRGRWSKGDQGVLHLKWFDWGAETFAPSGRFFHKVEPIRPPSPPPGSSPADKTIFIHAAGRTGNQLFQFAYGLHLQRKFGCLLRGNLRLLSGVPGIPGDVTHGEPSGPTVTICDVDDDAVARCLNNPLMAGAELRGFFQSAGHLEDGWGELRAILGDVSKQDAIGVHVRRGDYLGTAHDMNLPASYYLTGVRQIIVDHPYDYRGITVFSDDPAWCVTHLLADLREILPAKVFTGSELETLREMKTMRGMVITNSTFSWWGAWLADCPTMYPQTWPVPGGSLRPGLGCSRPHWKPNIEPESRLRNERIAKELVGTWDQYNDGVYCCQKTFFADGRVCYGASWTVEYDGTIRFGDHKVRLTPEGELAGATCHQVQLHYLRSSGPPGAARTNPDVLHEMVCLEVDRANPIDILAHLVETGVTAELVRYGPDSDGGYHVPFGIDYNKVLTIGVGYDIRFETHYARSHPGADFVLFDHTVSGLPEALPNSVFHRIGVGYGEACKPLPELLEGRIAATDTVLLKMDCEGGEWDCGMEHMSFDGIHTLVLEIHDTLRPADPAQAARVLAAVADHFILVHACPNNCSAAGTVQGHLLTNCVELTLVNRRHAAGLPPRSREPQPAFLNDPRLPPAELRILARKDRLPTIVSAFFDLGTFQKGTGGTRDAETYRQWLRHFAKLENPLVFFAETVEDMELVREIRRHTRHPTRVELVDRATLRAFSQVARVRDSIRHATFPTAHPNTTVAEYSCVQHAKYELVAHAMKAGWIETTRCCWMDCGKIFDVLALSDCRCYQLQHRPEFDDGIHYTRSRPFSPKSLDAIQSGNDGAGEYCHAGGFFYGRTDAMAAWCATYLEHALRYQAAGWVFTDQATLYAMLSEGLAVGVLAHPFADCWCGLCRYLLRAVRSGSDSPPPSSSPVGSAACGDPRERGGSPGMLSGGVDPTAGDRETAHGPGEGGCSPGPTILMGVCNGERYLGEAIASVLRQSYPGFRLIIGLNGCTDRSGDIARSFSDPRVTVIELPEKGRVASLNALLAMVDTEFIAIQDDDDVWLPNKLETQMRFTGKCDVLGTFVEYIDASGNCSGVRPLSCRTDAEIKAAMAEGNNQMVNSSMVLNTSQVRAENGWNVDFEGVEDFDLSIRLARRGCRFFNVPEVLVFHRIHAASNFNARGNHGQLAGLLKKHGIGR